MKKYLRVVYNFVIYDIPLEVIAEKRAESLAMIESKLGTREFNMIFSEEYQHGMDEDEVISNWAKENISWDKIKNHAIRMDILNKNEPVKDFKETMTVVFH